MSLLLPGGSPRGSPRGSPSGSPRNFTNEGKGNSIKYDDENTINIQYEDLDGDGIGDTIEVFEENEDERVSFKH
jgi:hypothetical protein